jgi:hypothetical protein
VCFLVCFFCSWFSLNNDKPGTWMQSGQDGP